MPGKKAPTDAAEVVAPKDPPKKRKRKKRKAKRKGKK